MALYDDNMFITYYENAVSVTNESHIVVGNRCMLDFVPDRFAGVIANRAGAQLFFVKENQPLTTNLQFKIDFSSGWVSFFEDSNDGETITFAYAKIGVVRYNANRIVSSSDDSGNIVETLDELIDEVRLDNSTANSAEVIRIQNENTRISSENTRISNNNTFVANNNTYTNSENIRISSENVRISSENTRLSQESARQTAINNLDHKGNWSNLVTYSKNNIVTYNGSSYQYVSVTPSTTIAPSDGAVWKLVSVGGSNIRYRNAHEVGVSYQPLDVVNYNNYQYINILATNSHLPTNATYWEIYNYTKVGELKSVITLSVAASQFNINIPEYNKNSDIIEIIQNNTRIWEGQEFSVSNFTQGLITKIGAGNWALGTVFYVRILKNMRVTINLQDGNLIESGTIGLSSLSPSVQSAILANTQMVRSYEGTLNVPFESATNDIDMSSIVSAYDYNLDCLLIYVNGRAMTLGQEYTKSQNRILKVSGNWGGNSIGDSDQFDVIVLKSVSNVPLSTYSGSLITDGTISNAKLSSLILQNIANMNSTGGLVTQTGTNTFTKRTIVSDSKLSITNGNGVSGNPTLTVNESNLTFATGLTQSNITTPTSPASTFTKLYPKSDGKFYKLDSSGVETCMEMQIKSQEFVATSGQTLFTLTNGTYTVGTKSLFVVIDGITQSPSAFTETSTSSFTLSEAMVGGEVVFAYWYTGVGILTNNEIETARANMYGVIYPTLSDRLDSIERQEVDAISYGFKNDGVTSNDTIMNAFITNDSNKTLVFPSGIYIFTTGFDFPSDMRLKLAPDAELKLNSPTEIECFFSLCYDRAHSTGYSYNSFIIGGIINGNYKTKRLIGTKYQRNMTISGCILRGFNLTSIQSHYSSIAEYGGSKLRCSHLTIQNPTPVAGTYGIYDNGFDNEFSFIEIENCEKGVYTRSSTFHEVHAWIKNSSLIPYSVFAEIEGYNLSFSDCTADTMRYGFDTLSTEGYTNLITNFKMIDNSDVYTPELLTLYPHIVFKGASNSNYKVVNAMIRPNAKLVEVEFPYSTFINVSGRTSDISNLTDLPFVSRYFNGLENLGNRITKIKVGLTKSSNLDTLFTNGEYECNFWTGTGGTGIPIEDKVGVLSVDSVNNTAGSNLAVQTFFSFEDRLTYKRLYISNSWTTWKDEKDISNLGNRITKIKVVLTQASNLNTLFTNGEYQADFWTGSGGVGIPVTNKSGIFSVNAVNNITGSNLASQSFYTLEGSIEFKRMYIGSSWSVWKSVTYT